MKRHLIHKKSKFLRRSRPYLLLEVLLGLALIALCFLPLVKPHVQIAQAQKAFIEKMQFDELAQNYFLGIKQQLFEGVNYSWKDLIKGCKGICPNQYALYYSKGHSAACYCDYTIEVDDTYNKTTDVDYLLLNIHLRLKTNNVQGPNYKFSQLVVCKPNP